MSLIGEVGMTHVRGQEGTYVQNECVWLKSRLSEVELKTKKRYILFCFPAGGSNNELVINAGENVDLGGAGKLLWGHRFCEDAWGGGKAVKEGFEMEGMVT